MDKWNHDIDMGVTTVRVNLSLHWYDGRVRARAHVPYGGFGLCESLEYGTPREAVADALGQLAERIAERVAGYADLADAYAAIVPQALGVAQ